MNPPMDSVSLPLFVSFALFYSRQVKWISLSLSSAEVTLSSSLVVDKADEAGVANETNEADETNSDVRNSTEAHLIKQIELSRVVSEQNCITGSTNMQL